MKLSSMPTVDLFNALNATKTDEYARWCLMTELKRRMNNNFNGVIDEVFRALDKLDANAIRDRLDVIAKERKVLLIMLRSVRTLKQGKNESDESKVRSSTKRRDEAMLSKTSKVGKATSKVADKR